ncbi:MAG: glycoside hydrolase family 5 protein [Lachnospiraceae bacterium]|nr:glycoside hydrolase family 5 protein [Lachnospiraceae bacterium]
MGGKNDRRPSARRRRCARIRRRLGSFLLAFCMIFTMLEAAPATTVSAASTPVSKHGQLSVDGVNFVDSSGNAFQLRGISTHGINWDVGSTYVSKKAFKTLRDGWGVNAIRLSMYTENCNGYCSGGDQSELKALVSKGVKYATDLGMYVIIDWHILSDGNPNEHITEAKAFFTTMAKKYKNYNNVIYEICNEPNGCSWKSIKSYAKKIIKAIRKYDKDAVIIVGTPSWSQLGASLTSNEVADDPITGYDNIMYSLHFYASEDAHSEYLPDKLNYALEKGLPVIVSEFGLSEADGNGEIDKTSANQWFKLLNKYNISYFCWSLSNKDESSSLLKAGTAKTSSWKSSDLSTAGKYIKKKYLARQEKLGAAA